MSDLAHCTALLIDLTLKIFGEIVIIMGTKVAFVIQKQRYLLNEAV